MEINATNFPDAIFREYVQTLEKEDNDDNILSAEEIAAVTSIDVYNKGISDLKGIEYFTALETLNCGSNSLTSLDVSENTELTWLRCDGNNLTSLDVSKNTALKYLYCYENPLIAVNAAGSISSFYASPLLPFTEKTAVICLADYGINADIITALEGGTVSDDGYLNVNGDKATYTYDIDGDLGTNNISCTINVSGIVISKENFPDANFRNYVQNFDTVDDEILSAKEIAAVTEINVSDMGICDLTGIEYFTALELLHCGFNSLTSLDFKQKHSTETAEM